MGFHYPPVPGRCHNRIQALIFTRNPRACACAHSSHVGPKPITRQFPASPVVPASFFCPPSHQLEGEGQLGFLLAGSAPWDPLQRGPNDACGDRKNPDVPLHTAATSPAAFLRARRVAHTHAQPPLSHRGSPARAELFLPPARTFQVQQILIKDGSRRWNRRPPDSASSRWGRQTRSPESPLPRPGEHPGALAPLSPPITPTI